MIYNPYSLTNRPKTMDPIEEVFTAMRVRSVLYSRLQAKSPWGISFGAGKLARFGLVVKGSCWLQTDSQTPPLALTMGDCFIINTNISFQLQDHLQSALLASKDIFTGLTPHSIVTLGGAGAITDIIIGRFYFDEDKGAPLMPILPNVMHIASKGIHTDLLQATLKLIDRETAEQKMGSQLVVRHLADVLLIQAMRAYFATEQSPIGWMAAWTDPHLKKALEALHHDLAYNWQVERLATIAGMSRSAFALHFKNVVGSPPLEYLLHWRLYRAKNLLKQDQLTLTQIANQVGYNTDSAFSRAFKRELGITPGQFRKDII